LYTPAAFVFGDTFELALLTQVRLELGEHAQHIQEALAGGRAGVDRSVAQHHKPTRVDRKGASSAAATPRSISTPTRVHCARNYREHRT
jgi:hypothetical protein